MQEAGRPRVVGVVQGYLVVLFVLHLAAAAAVPAVLGMHRRLVHEFPPEGVNLASLDSFYKVVGGFLIVTLLTFGVMLLLPIRMQRSKPVWSGIVTILGGSAATCLLAPLSLPLLLRWLKDDVKSWFHVV
ncbi:MAG: hypothetical protein MH204_05995 [Fimbriimonadaceae bacterium]|nr:hypothetical protein [Fimbriimonadaceae bacterium]